MMAVLSAVFRRELRLAARIGAGAELGLVFFLILVALVPFAIGPDRPKIAAVAPAVLWIAALLATLLGLDRLLQSDEEDGVLDLLAASPAPFEAVLLVKALAHWLVTGLPLSLAAPVLGVMLALPPEGMGRVMLSLLIGTPALTMFGLVGAAITVSLRRGGLLLSILVLPLCVPVLIFGVATAGGGDSAGPAQLLLGAGTLLSLAGAPFAAALALRSARG